MFRAWATFCDRLTEWSVWESFYVNNFLGISFGQLFSSLLIHVGSCFIHISNYLLYQTEYLSLCVCVWFFLFIVFHSRVNWSAFEIRFSCEKFVWSKRLRFCLDISFHDIMSTKRGRGGSLDPFKLDWDMNLDGSPWTLTT